MIRSVITLLICFGLTAIVSNAQSFKAGYVNSETIITELPEAKKASADIETLTLKIRDTLEIMQKDFESRIEQYRTQEALMSAEAKRKEEESLNALRMRFVQYQETKTAEMQQKRETYLRPIRDKVQAAIADVAKEEKLNVVLDKAAGIVLYSDDSSDITFKVLDRMQRGNK